MMRDLTRRRFIKGMGATLAASLATPLLPSLSMAQSGGEFPTRFIFFWTPQGTVMNRFMPNDSGRDIPLDDVTFPAILQPLAPHKDNLLLVRGMDNRIRGPAKNNHPRGTGTWLTGHELTQIGTHEEQGYPITIGGSISLDQWLGQQRDTRFKALNLGVQQRQHNTYVRTTLSYLGDQQPVSVEANPTAMYDRIWGADIPIAGPAEVRRKQLLQMRLQAIDLVKERLDKTRRRASAQDRQTFDAHVNSLREVEKRLLTSDEPLNCDSPMTRSIDPYQNNNYPEIGKLQMDIIVASLTCDLTRVATLMWDRAGSNTVFNWLGLNDTHHDLAHANNVSALVDINTWYAEQLAYLIDRLKSIPQGDGTLLDHTVLVWGNGMTSGSRHSNADYPIVIAGGGNGFFKTNRLVDADVAHNHLLVSIAHAMGHTELETFGRSEFVGPASVLHA